MESHSVSPVVKDAVVKDGEMMARDDDTIRIDVGRQLFVDDYLIAETALARSFHAATPCEHNPVLKPETPVEMNEGLCPVAAPFDDGVFYDPKDRLFKMWHMGGWFDGNCYAVRKDGLSWERPSLDVTPGTNRILPVRRVEGRTLMRDATTVWLDHDAPDPAQRFKMFVYSRLCTRPWGVDEKGEPIALPDGDVRQQAFSRTILNERGKLFTSPDGIHWDAPLTVRFPHGDNSSFYYDPFRRLWVFSVRKNARSAISNAGSVRARCYLAKPDFAGLADCGKEVPALWLRADEGDKPDPDLGYEPELYDFTAVGYESLMVGVSSIVSARTASPWQFMADRKAA